MTDVMDAMREATLELDALSRKAFHESWGTYNRARIVATLQECLSRLNELQTYLQSIHGELSRQQKPDYVEAHLNRIQEASQFLERNLLFEKSLMGRPEDETNHNETFAALQEKVQQVSSGVQLALQKTSLGLQLRNQNTPNTQSASRESITTVLQQKDRELLTLKEKLHQFEAIHLSVSENAIRPEVVEKKVFETAKKIEWNIQSLKQAERNQQQAISAWEKNTQEKMSILSSVDEMIPKFMSESMMAIAGLRGEIETLKQGMHLQQDEWQRLHEKNIAEITRLHEERATDQKEWETKNRSERKRLLEEIQQKNEMIAYFQKKQQESELEKSRMFEEIQKLKQRTHHSKETGPILLKKKHHAVKRKLRAPKIHSKNGEKKSRPFTGTA